MIVHTMTYQMYCNEEARAITARRTDDPVPVLIVPMPDLKTAVECAAISQGLASCFHASASPPVKYGHLFRSEDTF